MSFNVIPRRFAKPLISSVLAIALLIADLSVSPVNRVLASGTTITVNSLSDDQTAGTGVCLQSGTICLRNAIATANANTASSITIKFSVSGTITVGTQLSVTNSHQSITIDGSGHVIVINGGNSTRIFDVASGTTVTLNTLTLINGNSKLNSDFSGNGGGVFNSGTLTITNATLSGNVGNNGGAVSNGGTLAISNSTLSGNSASSIGGGGVFNYGTLTITSSIMSDNFANGYGSGGGGIYSSYGTVTITASTLSGNSASESGGGIDNSYGPLNINNSTLSGDSAGSGGGLLNDRGSLTVMISSTLSGNSVSAVGGGLYNDGMLTISGSTLSNNSANVGGGAYDEPYDGSDIRQMNLQSTIIAANSISGSGSGGPDVYGAINSLGHNLIGDGTDATGFLINDQVGASASPINPLIGTLANNGGPTQTMALLTGSPAIGQGNCNGNSTINPSVPTVTTDERGVLRKTPCDVGAFEYIPPKLDTIGIYRGGKFYLRLHNSIGNADLTVAFTAGTKPYPIVGDWTGAGFDTVGVFDQSNGKFTLCTANITASCANSANQKSLVLGVPNDQPLSGRWSVGATNAGVGVFRPSNGLIYLKNALTTGYADYTMVLGIPGDVGLAGDWNGKGFDSPGVYRPSNSTFYLSNQVKNGSVTGDYQVAYGLGGDAPVVGDWIAQGHDGIGLFRQSNGFTYLKNALTTGYADNSFTYGIAGDIPVAGHWQAVYPPIAPGMPPPVLIAKTAIPPQPDGSISSDNPLGD